MKQNIFARLALLTALLLALSGCGAMDIPAGTPALSQEQSAGSFTFSLDDIPEYSGDAYVVLNDNVPDFPEADKGSTTAFEDYSPLDGLGRCGPAYANVCLETMPTEKRGNIGQVKPSGWKTAKYDCVDGKYLYNRCHLIGYQLTAENANDRNLITGTRYMNVVGMLPFENLVADFVKETEYHVLYRVTPIFCEDELVARGVQMEALSVEDGGEGVCYNVYVYNVQPGVVISYADGDSHLADSESNGEIVSYVLNTNSKKFHQPGAACADSISESNRQDYSGTRENLIAQGYTPCGQCKP